MKINLKTENMQDQNALEGKTLAELREIGKALGLSNVMVKKRELLDLIAAAAAPQEEANAAGETVAAAEPAAPQAAKRGRRPRIAKTEPASQGAGEASVQREQPEPAARP